MSLRGDERWLQPILQAHLLHRSTSLLLRVSVEDLTNHWFDPQGFLYTVWNHICNNLIIPYWWMSSEPCPFNLGHFGCQDLLYTQEQEKDWKGSQGFTLWHLGCQDFLYTQDLKKGSQGPQGFTLRHLGCQDFLFTQEQEKGWQGPQGLTPRHLRCHLGATGPYQITAQS